MFVRTPSLSCEEHPSPGRHVHCCKFPCHQLWWDTKSLPLTFAFCIVGRRLKRRPWLQQLKNRPEWVSLYFSIHIYLFFHIRDGAFDLWGMVGRFWNHLLQHREERQIIHVQYALYKAPLFDWKKQPALFISVGKNSFLDEIFHSSVNFPPLKRPWLMRCFSWIKFVIEKDKYL